MAEGGTTRPELGDYFFLMSSSLLDFYLTRLAQDGLLEIVEERIQVTTKAQEANDGSPGSPVRVLTVFAGER